MIICWKAWKFEGSKDENRGKWSSEAKWGTVHSTAQLPAIQGKGWKIGNRMSGWSSRIRTRRRKEVSGRTWPCDANCQTEGLRREITDILRQYLPRSRNCKFVHEPIEYEPLNLNVFTRNYRFLRPTSICLTIDIIQLDNTFFDRRTIMKIRDYKLKYKVYF